MRLIDDKGRCTMTEEFYNALNVLSAATTKLWNDMSAPPKWRWCAARMMEAHAAVLRELQCYALRDACALDDDAAVVVAAREYMQRKATHHMMMEARMSAREIASAEWTEWAASVSGMRAPSGARRDAAMAALERALATLRGGDGRASEEE